MNIIIHPLEVGWDPKGYCFLSYSRIEGERKYAVHSCILGCFAHVKATLKDHFFFVFFVCVF